MYPVPGYFVSGTVLGPWDTGRHKTDKIFCSNVAYLLVGGDKTMDNLSKHYLRP